MAARAGGGEPRPVELDHTVNSPPRRAESETSTRRREGMASAPSPRLRGEGRGEGRKQVQVVPIAAPHPNPLPTEEWGEGISWGDVRSPCHQGGGRKRHDAPSQLKSALRTPATISESIEGSLKLFP